MARRDAELRLAARYFGDLPISRVLPNTDPEVATFRSEVERALAGSAKANYLSAQTVVDRHRDPDDAFSLADFDFIHFPGGHAPMVDFRDSLLPDGGREHRLSMHGDVLTLSSDEQVWTAQIAGRRRRVGCPFPQGYRPAP